MKGTPGYSSTLSAKSNNMADLLFETEASVSSLLERIEQLETRLAEVEAQIPSDRITIVVFSGDLDRVIAALIIGSGALAMGYEVSYYFTFWGITAVKESKTLSGKSLYEKMMTLMTPVGTEGLGVSKMNFFGIGARMLRTMMKQNNVESVESMFQMIREMGATMYSCTMSQDVMGIEASELIDGMVDAGVGTMVSEGIDSKFTLFI